MKNILIVLLIIAAAGLGGLEVYQRKEFASLKTDLATTQEQLKLAQAKLAERAAADERIVQAERKAKLLQDTLTQASEVSASQSRQVADLEQSLASSKTNSGGLAGLFKNPQMREMIKAQQKAVMGPMIERNYAAFFKQLNLTPEQATYVKELLEKKSMVGAEMGMAMFDESVDAEKRKELGKQIKTETDAVDEELKKFLGDDYAAYKDYEKTLPDRMNANQFKDQVAGSDNALDAAQEKQLLDALKDLRASFKMTTDFRNPEPGKTDPTEMFNEERVAKHFEEMAEHDRLLIQKAAAFMRPDQLAAYTKHLESQRAMQAAGMKMAAAMFQKAKK